VEWISCFLARLVDRTNGQRASAGFGLLRFYMDAAALELFAALGLLGAYTAVTGDYPIRAYDNSWKDVVVVVVIVLLGLCFKAWLAVEFGVR